ncbi:FMN-binding negative transcriptional regulator [uncultured Tateyamaria sp.]|uniref:FMN-binding negative transcriptional regulator n=1 Tax=uncultured Tateyamaria sp. TaxID=455651 RepID=UPI002639E757|nr:FMN-binding negative transcriptional regulator [uncultured Tateyamaria sp.]
MHPNPIFHTQDGQRNLAYASERAFGILAVNAEAGPLMAHIPFLIDEDGAYLHLHLVRSNPIARALKTPLTARIAVNGPDGYISPDWYEVSDQVPTWNYVAVHLTGMLELRPQDELRDLLDRQSKHFEDQLQPKTPWKTDKMTPDVLEKMMRQIVPYRMKIEGVDGTWKLNQNKPDKVRLRAADYVDAYGMGAETRLLAALMRGA